MTSGVLSRPVKQGVKHMFGTIASKDMVGFPDPMFAIVFDITLPGGKVLKGWTLVASYAGKVVSFQKNGRLRHLCEHDFTSAEEVPFAVPEMDTNFNHGRNVTHARLISGTGVKKTSIRPYSVKM